MLPPAAAESLLHATFRRAAATHAHQVAVEIPPGQGRPERCRTSYGQLQAEAWALAGQLAPWVTHEVVVAILLPRTCPSLYAAQLGVLEAGAAYLCLDPSLPDAHHRAQLLDCQAVVLLTDRAGARRVRALGLGSLQVLEVVSVPSTAVAEPRLPPWVTPSSLAYLIYTSGTTGRPKGVMIEHRSITSLVASDVREFGLGPGDRVALSSSVAYDSSVEEIWLAWATGATLVVADDETVRMGPDLVGWLRAERIAMLCPPPTLLRALGCEEPGRALPDLRWLYVGGEPLPPDVAAHWSTGPRLVNGYGPTECTVTATRAHIAPGCTVTLGHPVPGLEAHVLDAGLCPVAEGEEGELCLSGVGLARGYYNQPDLTAQSFVEHPALGRIYRTGDLVQRDAAGALLYRGRRDAQVKLRGYRIELEAIEALLVEHPQVREAACCLQGAAGHEMLVAFVVPQAGELPSMQALRDHLAEHVPDYMVPKRYGQLALLPRSRSGKLDRAALASLPACELKVRPRGGPGGAPGAGPHDPSGAELAARLEAAEPRDALEVALACAVRQVLAVPGRVGREDDFFDTLGGDSLRAALLVGRLRQDARLASLTVRDVYELRSPAALAERLRQLAGLASSGREDRSKEEPAPVHAAPPSPGDAEVSSPRWHEVEVLSLLERTSPVLFTCCQALVLLLGGGVAASLLRCLTGGSLPWLLRHVGGWGLVALTPLLGILGVLLHGVTAVLLTCFLKWLLIGRYRPVRVPAWGAFHLRHWVVTCAAGLIPWGLLAGTSWLPAVLRLLGAHIGQRAYIHAGVALASGGWDLLTLGDDVTLGQDVSLRLVTVEAGHLVAGPIVLGCGATLEVRAGVDAFTRVEAGGSLGPLSALLRNQRIPPGERWEGVPARCVGAAQDPWPGLARPQLQGSELSPLRHAVLLVLGRLAAWLAVPMLLEVLALAAVVTPRWRGGAEAWSSWEVFWLSSAQSWLGWRWLPPVLAVPVALLAYLVALRALGGVSPGALGVWTAEHLRLQLTSAIVAQASFWLGGTLMWPAWLRAAGMRIGRRGEISTLIDVIPELTRVGDECFLADGIYLGGARLHRGRAWLAEVHLGHRVFVGNHAVVAAGLRVPDDTLLGVCTVAERASLRPGTAWFGEPPFELGPRPRPVVDRSLTHAPGALRLFSRWCWELLRFALPLPGLALLVGVARWTASPGGLAGWGSELASLLLLATGPLLVLVSKWLLLGRVRPGQHPLYSCWCSRWDFHYTLWALYGQPLLGFLEGTLLLHVWLRCMGARIGRRVLLGDGFAHVVDPDMLDLADDATVACHLQAHTFEERVLKLDHVRVGAQATVAAGSLLLYGAEVGDRSLVLPHSVVMKGEVLPASGVFLGAPTCRVGGGGLAGTG